MSLLHGKTNRRILPRWRESNRASQAADFSALKPLKKASGNRDEELQQVADDFTRLPTIGTAAELLASSLLVGKGEVADAAAKFILARETDVPRTLLHLAKSVVDGGSPFSAKDLSQAQQIAQTRSLLRTNSDNPLLWSDMARHHASLGQKKQSHRCMQIALHLAPNHRWVLRAATRFLVHQEDPIAAHKLLANHPRTRNDPWLIAAELACAHVAGRAPKFWRQAVDLLKSDAVSPPHLSELATAVAMMELDAGERKKARKYVHKGLIAPTENTLAQVSWARENKNLDNSYGLDELIKSTEDAYEADFRVKLVKGDLLAALTAAETWAGDEPFAARPRAEIVYVASLLDRHDLAVEMVNQVALLDGHVDPTLEMNSIFAQISSGGLKIDSDASQIAKLHSMLLSAIELGDGNAYHAMANLGLWYYRYGDAAVGRELYQKAIAIAQKQHLTEVAAMAAIFAARESILAKESSASAALQHARELVKKSRSKPGDFYVRKLDELLANPWNSSEILSPASAPRFLKQDAELPQFRVEKTDKGHVLYLRKKAR